MKVMPALCLDLDGTIRYSKRGIYAKKPEDYAIFPTVEEIIWDFKKKGFLICGVTNQGGVAFGHKTPKDNERELEFTRSLFEKDPFDMIQYAYCMEGGKIFEYSYRSLLRKPYIGMLVKCEIEAKKQEIIIDWNKSILVGDMETDKLCAENAKIKFFWAKDFFHLEDI